MSLLGGFGAILGIGPDPEADALSAFGGGTRGIAGRLRRFRPFRTTSALGTQRIFKQDGKLKLDIDSPELDAAVARFSQAVAGGQEATLAKLRKQGDLKGDANRLRKRAIAQGRLDPRAGGKEFTGDLSSFFSSAQDADIGLQLAAPGENRRLRGALLSEAGGFRGLLSGELQSLFQADQLQSAREIAGANIQQAGLQASLRGRLGEAKRFRSLLGGSVSSLGVGPISAGF